MVSTQKSLSAKLVYISSHCLGRQMEGLGEFVTGHETFVLNEIEDLSLSSVVKSGGSRMVFFRHGNTPVSYGSNDAPGVDGFCIIT